MSGAHEQIAVIGMACRFPGASDPDAFWELLRDGRDAVSEIPPSRWDVAALYAAEPGRAGRMATRHAGLIDGIDQFDEAFFGVAPREAAAMDPQQRLLLEVAWEAIEDAGLPRERLAGSATGVFVGIATYDYAMIQPALDRVEAWSATGTALSIAANRISYAFDLRGPSLAIDTACSSSLVAVHQARRSLLNGESDVALAGGVNALLSPAPMIALSAARMMAADGRCKTFDAAADGYVRGEGCGVVVLKRLSDARAAGDRILAVIHGSAVNQDGRSNGLTAPNGPAQEAVVRAALADAGAAPDAIGYVEAHGTGTRLGDPIEVLALANVLPGPCLIGSVKTNVGHLEAAAGIAGLIKTVQSLRRGIVPPSLHFHAPNPEIPFDRLPLRVASQPQPWPAGRLAGISSFGFGGTNAHVVIGPGAADPGPAAADAGRTAADADLLLLLSAHTAQALARRAGDLAARVRAAAGLEELRSIAFTLAARRSHLEHRAAVVGGDAEELACELEAVARGDAPAASTGRRPLRGCAAIALVVPPGAAIDAQQAAALERTASPQAGIVALWRAWGLAFEHLDALELNGSVRPGQVVLVATHAPGFAESTRAAAPGTRVVTPSEPGRRGLLRALGTLFTLGASADWSAALPAGGACVALPRFAWQHRTHWFDPTRAPSNAPSNASGPSADRTSRGAPATSLPLAVLEWEPLAAVAPDALAPKAPPAAATVAATAEGGQFLLLADAGGVAAAVAGQLERAGAFVHVVPGGFPVADAMETRTSWDAVVDFGALDGGAVIASAMRRWRDVLRSGVHGPLVAVTRGGQTVRPTEAPDPGQTAVWGLMRTLAVEQRERAGGLIDVDGAAPAALAAPICALLRERGEAQSAIRDGAPFVPRLRPLVLEPGPAYEPDPEATYLITGGTGALGMAVAHRLAALGARHIVLANREPNVPAADAARFVAAGAAVRAAVLDVADRAAVAALVSAVAGERPLRGILHLAGVIDFTLLADADWDSSAQTIGAKLDGAAALDAASENLELDFFTIFSSTSGLFGIAGAASYGAANAGSDAVATRRRGRGLAALAIAWGRWADIGLGHRTASRLGARHRTRGINPEHGVDALFALLARARELPPNVAVLEPDWAETARFAAFAAPGGWLSSIAQSEPIRRETAGVPAISLDDLLPTQRRAAVRALIDAAVTAVLRLADELDGDVPLRDVGLDSLTAIELRDLLQRRTGLILAPTVAIEHPTVDALVDALLAEYGAAESRRPLPAGNAAAHGRAPVPAGHAAAADAAPPPRAEWNPARAPSGNVLEQIAELDDAAAWLAFGEALR